MQLTPANEFKMAESQHVDGVSCKLKQVKISVRFLIPISCSLPSSNLPSTVPEQQHGHTVNTKPPVVKPGISAVNQLAEILFGWRLLLPSSCRACHCGRPWHADTEMESYTGRTAVCFHFKHPPLPLPQFVL